MALVCLSTPQKTPASQPRISPISGRIAPQALSADSASASICVIVSRAAVCRCASQRSDISCTTPEWPATIPPPETIGRVQTSIQRQVESGVQMRNVSEYSILAAADQLAIIEAGSSSPSDCAHDCRVLLSTVDLHIEVTRGFM